MTRKKELLRAAYLLLAAAAIITCCSKSSPLYPFNDWVDANCYFTVGKSFWKGIIVYRDLFEQKGPLLYLIHSLAYLFSHDSFFGAYLFEVLAAFILLWFSYKALKLLYSDRVLAFLPVCALGIYTSAAFAHGDSAEEFCLPLLAYGIYIAIKAVKENCLPAFWPSFFIGITSSTVLWIKFSMLGFYFGWIIVIGYIAIRCRDRRGFIRLVLGILAGVLALSLPILVYFGLNNALDDLFTVYFYDNLFIYGRKLSIFERVAFVFNSLKSSAKANRLPWALLVLGLLPLLVNKERRRYLYSLAVLLATTAILIFAGGLNMTYYSLILTVFSFIGAGTLSLLMPPQLDKCSSAIPIVTLIVAVILAYGTSPNAFYRQYQKSDLPQYQFAEVIDSSADRTLLNYGFLDGGFYTVAQVFPTERFFCGLNIPLPDIQVSQDECIREGRVEFVVSASKLKNADKYHLVMEKDFRFEGIPFTYYLYQRSN